MLSFILTCINSRYDIFCILSFNSGLNRFMAAYKWKGKLKMVIT
jgi:hypothetical protein